MVAFLFLFAPVVVLVAILIMQRFQPRHDRDQDTWIERVVEDGRIEPSFSAVNDNAGYGPDPGITMDRRSISTG